MNSLARSSTRLNSKLEVEMIEFVSKLFRVDVIKALEILESEVEKTHEELKRLKETIEKRGVTMGDVWAIKTTFNIVNSLIAYLFHCRVYDFPPEVEERIERLIEKLRELEFFIADELNYDEAEVFALYKSQALSE